MQETNLNSINLSTIKEAGLLIDTDLNLKSLNERVSPEGKSEIYFKEAPKAKIEIRSIGKTDDFELSATLSFSYMQCCGRCSEFKEQAGERKCSILLQKRNAENKDQEDDVGVIYYKEPEINVEDILQEEVILSIHPFLIPETDTQEKCKLCKLKIEMPNEKVGQSIGDLLKKL